MAAFFNMRSNEDGPQEAEHWEFNAGAFRWESNGVGVSEGSRFCHS